MFCTFVSCKAVVLCANSPENREVHVVNFMLRESWKIAAVDAQPSDLRLWELRENTCVNFNSMRRALHRRPPRRPRCLFCLVPRVWMFSGVFCRYWVLWGCTGAPCMGPLVRGSLGPAEADEVRCCMDLSGILDWSEGQRQSDRNLSESATIAPELFKANANLTRTFHETAPI